MQRSRGQQVLCYPKWPPPKSVRHPFVEDQSDFDLSRALRVAARLLDYGEQTYLEGLVARALEHARLRNVDRRRQRALLNRWVDVKLLLACCQLGQEIVPRAWLLEHLAHIDP